MGRHREFDVENALDAAMCVFWSKGYEGASYTDLTEATGVERPALYSAFGNKEALFNLALARYNEHYLTHIPEALAKPKAREVAAHMLYSSAELNTRYPTHTGCLNINGAVAASDASEPIRQALIKTRADGELRFVERFERARAEGDLPQSAKPAALAAFLMAVLHGMAVQAKAGFDRATLEAVAEQALSAWPE
tara:strand:- start:8585 stop:9166 length:582 start_codon:yes stop_codon:yes gene_type:complete